jgi:hypothetical protein
MGDAHGHYACVAALAVRCFSSAGLRAERLHCRVKRRPKSQILPRHRSVHPMSATNALWLHLALPTLRIVKGLGVASSLVPPVLRTPAFCRNACSNLFIQFCVQPAGSDQMFGIASHRGSPAVNQLLNRCVLWKVRGPLPHLQFSRIVSLSLQQIGITNAGPAQRQDRPREPHACPTSNNTSVHRLMVTETQACRRHVSQGVIPHTTIVVKPGQHKTAHVLRGLQQLHELPRSVTV